jgi:hypothetical protein
MLVTFLICLFIWTLVVDNLFIPSFNDTVQDNGEYTRYRVKKWDNGKTFGLLKDEIMVYAIVRNRERLYYIQYQPHLEQVFKDLQKGSPVQLRYVKRFPKFWKKNLYDLRVNGLTMARYSAHQIKSKQEDVWKFTGIMGGVYLFLVILGLINKPRRR